MESKFIASLKKFQKIYFALEKLNERKFKDEEHRMEAERKCIEKRGSPITYLTAFTTLPRPDEPQEMPNVLTYDEAAEYLGLSRKQLVKLINAGGLKPRKQPNRNMLGFSIERLNKYLLRCRVPSKYESMSTTDETPATPMENTQNRERDRPQKDQPESN
jgi:hypothetical protein